MTTTKYKASLFFSKFSKFSLKFELFSVCAFTPFQKSVANRKSHNKFIILLIHYDIIIIILYDIKLHHSSDITTLNIILPTLRH